MSKKKYEKLDTEIKYIYFADGTIAQKLWYEKGKIVKIENYDYLGRFMGEVIL